MLIFILKILISNLCCPSIISNCTGGTRLATTPTPTS